jgi:hypothetical protein
VSGVARGIALPMERQSWRRRRGQRARGGSSLRELEHAGSRSSIGSGSVLGMCVDKPVTRSLGLAFAQDAVRVSKVGESVKLGHQIGTSGTSRPVVPGRPCIRFAAVGGG